MNKYLPADAGTTPTMTTAAAAIHAITIITAAATITAAAADSGKGCGGLAVVDLYFVNLYFIFAAFGGWY